MIVTATRSRTRGHSPHCFATWCKPLVAHAAQRDYRFFRSRAELASKDETNSRAYADYIGEGGRRLLSLIDQVGALSEIEARQGIPAHQMFSVGELIRNTIVLITAEARYHGVELRASAPPDALIYGDAAQIERVLVNVIAAAIKVSAPGGIVDIGLDVRENGDTAIAGVNQDTGLSKDAQAALLEPFGRPQGRAISRNEGRSLDLDIPLAKSLVELHGGSLEIESDPTAGLTLTMVMPARPSL